MGNNYLQLGPSGSIVINGGTFNQGTISSNPFNVNGTGNSLTISSGVINLTNSFQLLPGLTFTQTGGTVNATGGETDFNSTTNFLNGGVFNTTLITGVNGAGGSTFNISAGVLNLSDATGIYGGGATQYINFTPTSTGLISFNNPSVTLGQVQGFVANGAIEFNNNPNSSLSDFNIQQGDGFITISPAAAIPEPNSAALMILGGTGVLIAFMRRRFA